MRKVGFLMPRPKACKAKVLRVVRKHDPPRTLLLCQLGPRGLPKVAVRLDGVDVIPCVAPRNRTVASVYVTQFLSSFPWLKLSCLCPRLILLNKKCRPQSDFRGEAIALDWRFSVLKVLTSSLLIGNPQLLCLGPSFRRATNPANMSIARDFQNKSSAGYAEYIDTKPQ